jgi:hypothetical protein
MVILLLVLLLMVMVVVVLLFLVIVIVLDMAMIGSFSSWSKGSGLYIIALCFLVNESFFHG